MDITHTPIADMVMVVAVEPVFSYCTAMITQGLLSLYSSVKLVIYIFSFPQYFMHGYDYIMWIRMASPFVSGCFIWI
jgi:hypothetical protein